VKIDETALRERAALGSRFKEVLPDIQDGLDAIEREYADEWANTHDAAERENLWRSVQIIRKLKGHFGEIVSSGAIATHQLVELKRLGK
jgi:hypothetical protein